MTTTIAHSTGTITPTAVEGYKSSRASRTVVHEVLDRPAPDVTLRAFGLRVGSFHLVFAAQADALAAEAALAKPQTLTISNDEVAAVNMTFIIPEGGNLDVEQDRDTTDLWRVVVPFQEVAP